MVDAILEGKLRAMYLYGEEMSLVDSNSNLVGSAFEKLEFFVMQDIFFTNTCRFADIVLPASRASKKKGLSRAPNGEFNGSIKCWSLWQAPNRIGRLFRR
jgi:predicted molibdopterin-dependent oxidoreductase YjgC